MRAMWTAVALCAALAGCDRLDALRMDSVEKINAAWPTPAEVRVAEERLVALLQDDGPGRDSLRKQIASRMTLRALNCAKDVQVSRTDTVAAVRARLPDGACFQKQDQDLLKLYGLRTVGILMARPPLRPMADLGPVAPLQIKGMENPNYQGIYPASAAGVAVVRGPSGEIVAVELPGGKQVSALPKLAAYSGEVSVSPNGRLSAHSQGNNLVFMDVESGSRLWDTDEATRVVAWLPNASGLLLQGRNSALLLADAAAGAVEPHPVGQRGRQWSLALPGAQGDRVLLASQREIQVVDHVRSNGTLQANTVRQYRLGTDAPGVAAFGAYTGAPSATPQQNLYMSGAPALMRNGGLLVFQANSRDIGWLDMESRAQGVWQVSPLFIARVAKLNETQLLLESSGMEAVNAGRLWMFDITAESVAPVDDTVSSGNLMDFAGRTGFARRGSQVWLGDKVSLAGAAKNLAGMVSDFNLQQQITRLERMAVTGEGLVRVPSGNLVRQAPLEMSVQTVPGLSNVPLNAVVHMVGVYEPDRKAPLSGEPTTGNRPMRDVRVQLSPSSTPVVLVLASYEPVRWVVQPNGAQVSAVLLSGYYHSAVTGVGNVPQLRIGRSYAYAATSSEYVQLRTLVMQYTGSRPIRSFQGAYSGLQFTVN